MNKIKYPSLPTLARSCWLAGLKKSYMKLLTNYYYATGVV
jgi:hypothetical protein